MKASAIAIVVLIAALSTPLISQTTASQSVADRPVGPAEISGMASSARHCVSGDAANVHSIGWLENGTGYTVTFDADFDLVAGVSRLYLEEERAASAFGSPELRLTASTPGTMALFVGGTRQTGCYSYKVELQPPSQSSGSGAPVSSPRMPPRRAMVKPPKNTFRSMEISGLASSAKHCVGGNWVANVHGIGRVEQGAGIRIEFESDFDPIAGLTIMNMDAQRCVFRPS